MKDYVVGIDTGGTFTDGVLLDFRTRRVLASAKTLTTRDDLARGVVGVLKSLPIRDPDRVKLVGISSTLATNSVAEGKARRAGLLLIGYDPDLVESFGLSRRLGASVHAFVAGGHTSQGKEKEPLDEDALARAVDSMLGQVEALAVSSYFSPLNPAHEQRALALIRGMCDLPVVLGHQLSTRLDSIKRATTAGLNASLVPVMAEFIRAVETALSERAIRAPLMIVKGDGSLMPHAEALEKPVETILSGPAASAMGGRFLSGRGNALVIDVGGTTTDMALIENHATAVTREGARVGDIRTAVEAARIRTACVGCDSRIRPGQGREIRVGPDRVVPLSRLAAAHPGVERELSALSRKNPALIRKEDLEYWSLPQPPEPGRPRAQGEKRILALLEKGPMALSRVLSALGAHHAAQLSADDLLRTGIIEEAGLTPTDILHASGRMDAWNASAASAAVAAACALHGRDRASFIQDTIDHIISVMVEEAVVFLASHDREQDLPDRVDGTWGRWLLSESMARGNPLLSVTIGCRVPIIGIGAPAQVFVKRVAEALKATFVLPPHAPVANAVGAVAGSIAKDAEAILYLREEGGGRAWVVQLNNGNKTFKEYDEAREWAEESAAASALEKALQAGAEHPQVLLTPVTEGSLERIRARAVGNPRLSSGRPVNTQTDEKRLPL
ncbi:MAG: hydantoinase/oxoprolinase family protein [Proteobacteria bacterium]|nr:hydantoinase/oxoprolinase family protein [Pseudomonadota bacterium]